MKRRRPRRKRARGPKFASTAARHLAERFGLDAQRDAIALTGARGTITVQDVRAARGQATEETPSARAPAHAHTRKHTWAGAGKMPDWAPKFLDALTLDPNGSRAAAGAGIGRQHAYRIRADNKPFREAWDEAVETSTDELESEFRRRGLKGDDEPIFQGGRLVGFRRHYSDFAAGMLLKAHRPEKYREVHEVRSVGDFRVRFPETPEGESRTDAAKKLLLEKLAGKKRAGDGEGAGS